MCTSTNSLVVTTNPRRSYPDVEMTCTMHFVTKSVLKQGAMPLPIRKNKLGSFGDFINLCQMFSDPKISMYL